MSQPCVQRKRELLTLTLRASSKVVILNFVQYGSSATGGFDFISSNMRALRAKGTFDLESKFKSCSFEFSSNMAEFRPLCPAKKGTFDLDLESKGNLTLRALSHYRPIWLFSHKYGLLPTCGFDMAESRPIWLSVINMACQPPELQF